jgi:hypothetical protein
VTEISLGAWKAPRPADCAPKDKRAGRDRLIVFRLTLIFQLDQNSLKRFVTFALRKMLEGLKKLSFARPASYFFCFPVRIFECDTPSVRNPAMLAGYACITERSLDQ